MYSSTIASWIMVSSRCVAGLSTGMRPVSAMQHDEQRRQRPGSRSDGSRAALRRRPHELAQVQRPGREPHVKSPSISAGSARAAIVISRLAPMPPNGLPVSSAARGQRKTAEREECRRAAGSRLPPRAAPPQRAPARGWSRRRPSRSRRAAPPRTPRTRCSERTGSLRESLARSEYALQQPRPLPVLEPAFIFLMTAAQQRREQQEARGLRRPRTSATGADPSITAVLPATTSSIDAEHEHVGEVGVEAAGLDDLQPLRGGEHAARAAGRRRGVRRSARSASGSAPRSGSSARSRRLDLARRAVDAPGRP